MTESPTSAKFSNFSSSTLAVEVSHTKCIADDVHHTLGYAALAATYEPNASVQVYFVAKDGGDCFFDDSVYEFTIIEGTATNHVELAKYTMTCSNSDWTGVLSVMDETVASFVVDAAADESLFAVEAHPYTIAPPTRGSTP